MNTQYAVIESAQLSSTTPQGRIREDGAERVFATREAAHRRTEHRQGLQPLLSFQREAGKISCTSTVLWT